jgi:metal-responsive CopG/Arc/MetJ family transcriptional regulator
MRLMSNTYPTETRVIILVPHDLLDEVEAYRHRHRIPTRSETIRRMLLTAILQDQPADQDVAA